jgi:tetratricopeptide (TPR) repeat protein
LVTENLVNALKEARIARKLCPLSPFPQMLMAKLCFIDESPLHDEFYFNRVERLVGGRENWLFELGALHLDAGRPERAFALWRRCLEMNPVHEQAIVHLASGFLTPAQMLNKVLPNSPETLARIARRYFAGDDHRTDRRLIMARAAAALDARPQLSVADLGLRGSIDVELGDYATAVHRLERAIAIDDTHADWYFEMATAYSELGNWERAADYAKLGLQREPNSPHGRNLLDKSAEAIRKSPIDDKVGTDDMPKTKTNGAYHPTE